MSVTGINEELASRWRKEYWADIIEEMTEDITETFLSFVEEEMPEDEHITEKFLSLKGKITGKIRDSLYLFGDEVNGIIRDAIIKEIFQRIDKILRRREGKSILDLPPLERMEIEDILRE